MSGRYTEVHVRTGTLCSCGCYVPDLGMRAHMEKVVRDQERRKIDGQYVIQEEP